ncbi:MAG: hypothetical protein IPP89_14255 [Saprospiraceae bacterium]|nr:hypothetical protein [Candidatus Brachybacter algidus]MBL0120099.1 hypothetical protein [Candidatus Brachybacter algidus]
MSTGEIQTFEVPAGVTSHLYRSKWAKGSNAQSGAGAGLGASGGKASGNLAVTPGQIINIYVGGSGNGSSGGFNGGGAGGSAIGGGGGGASDVRIGGIRASRIDRTNSSDGGGGAGGTLGNGGNVAGMDVEVFWANQGTFQMEGWTGNAAVLEHQVYRLAAVVEVASIRVAAVARSAELLDVSVIIKAVEAEAQEAPRALEE